ncbi:RNA-binding S4 domain-containing protein [Crocinitomix catalasitica]|nr:RNA-binding S4 domain-containing protein [Crocinitomix catalasitica]
MNRIDKYVWSVRLAKTRSMATNWCKSNKILLNGSEVKPAQSVKIGDKIAIKKNAALFTYEVLDLLERRVGAKLVDQYLLDITSEEEIEKYKTYQAAQREYRRSGLAKPSTKERRILNKFWKNK